MAPLSPLQRARLEKGRRGFAGGSFSVKTAALLFFLSVPVLFPSFKTVDLAMKIMLFGVLVASFDILLGYTGILSFGHGMFFGIGAYCVALLGGKYGAPSYLNLALGLLLGGVVAAALALLISFLSLRVKAIFFAMVTLAIAELAMVLAIKLSGFSGGEDGISMSMPGMLAVSFTVGKVFGFEVTGRIVTYYLLLIACAGLFASMLRFIHSPLGHVLEAIRDNVQRADALGYKTFIFQGISITFGCIVASLAGGLYAMWVGYVNPESCLSVSTIMLDILFMVIIGGMGTLYGGILGAAFVLVAQTFLPDLQHLAARFFPHAPLLHNVLDRWLLLFGILFILVVIFFPKGILGTIRERWA
jgi:branched-chain amino acid transport system permease protein